MMSAPDADETGAQFVVGSVPPPWPEPMHWLTVAGEVDPTPVTLLTTFTLQVMIDPPALAELLHWFTDPTMSTDGAPGVVTHSASPGGPAQVVVVTVELVSPVATSRLLMTVTSQRISRAAPVSSKLHWLIVSVRGVRRVRRGAQRHRERGSEQQGDRRQQQAATQYVAGSRAANGRGADHRHEWIFLQAGGNRHKRPGPGCAREYPIAVTTNRQTHCHAARALSVRRRHSRSR